MAQQFCWIPRNRPIHDVTSAWGETLLAASTLRKNLMNSDPSGKENLPGMTPRREVDLNAGTHSKPAEVPVFNCIVYVSPHAGGGVRARVANLPGLECTAASEREALGKIVPAFKRWIGQQMRSETPIPWIDPPRPAEAGEQVRFIPVHL